MKIESEKNIEKSLWKEVKSLGGWAIKLSASHITGLPDRLCLLPGGLIFFVEVKTTKKKPRKIQLIVHEKLRNLGFEVFIIDRIAQIKPLIKNYIELR